MDLVAQLMVVVGTLWAVLSGFVASAFKFLLEERKTKDEVHRQEIAKFEKKLEDAGNVIIRQNEAMQKQIDAQNALVTQQQQMIAALQSLAKGPSA